MVTNLLIGVTGSVASIKLPLLAQAFNDIGDFNIKIVTTGPAKHFYKEHIKSDIGGSYISVKDKEGNLVKVPVYDDEYEWKSWNEKGDPVQHIELRKWAQIFLIAPLDANTLGKVANGLCDNLLTSILRAWDLNGGDKRIVIAPAMNTLMWKNPFTEQHLNVLLKVLGVHIIYPIEKLLACGDQGVGAMASVDEIVDGVTTLLNK